MSISFILIFDFTSQKNRGIQMIKDNLLKSILASTLLVTAVFAQDNVDAIEKARQAKEAADKAAEEAAAATSAAIEQAAAQAAKEARAEAKRKKVEEEERKIAEAEAAEEAELDAAASAAAEEAKRKMAAELGLEVDPPDDEAVVEGTIGEEEVVEDVVAKEDSGWNIGAAASVGLVKGESFSGGLPTGGTVVITTPFGFKLGPFDYTVSIGFGGYSASFEDDEGLKSDFNPGFVGIGGNLTIAKFIFAEGHVGSVGEGSGFRGFAGITLERLMKNSLNLPVNLLIGSEAFYSTSMTDAGNPSGWAAVGIRLDYGF